MDIIYNVTWFTECKLYDGYVIFNFSSWKSIVWDNYDIYLSNWEKVDVFKVWYSI